MPRSGGAIPHNRKRLEIRRLPARPTGLAILGTTCGPGSSIPNALTNRLPWPGEGGTKRGHPLSRPCLARASVIGLLSLDRPWRFLRSGVPQYASAHTCSARFHLVKLEDITGPIMQRAKLKGGETGSGRSRARRSRAGRAMRSWPAPGLQFRSPKGGQRSLRHLSRAYAARLCERARPSILCGFDCRDACSWAAKAHSYANLRRCSRCRRLSVRPAA